MYFLTLAQLTLCQQRKPSDFPNNVGEQNFIVEKNGVFYFQQFQQSDGNNQSYTKVAILLPSILVILGKQRILNERQDSNHQASHN